MKKIDTAKAVNNIAIFLLLSASVSYHVIQGIKDKSAIDAGNCFDIGRSIFQKSILPDSNPFFILSK